MTEEKTVGEIQGELESYATEFVQKYGLSSDGEGFHTATSYLVPAIGDGRKVMLKVVRPDMAEHLAPDIYRHFNAGGVVEFLKSEDLDDGYQIQLMERVTSSAPSLKDMAYQSDNGDERAIRIICGVVKKLCAVPLGAYRICERQTFDRRTRSLREHLSSDSLPEGLRNIFQRALDLHGSLSKKYEGRFVLGHGDNQHFNIIHDGNRDEWVAIDPCGLYAPLPFHLACLGFNPFDPADQLESPVAFRTGRMERLCEILAAEFRSDELTKKDFLEVMWLNSVLVAAMRYGEPLYPGEASFEYFMSVAKEAAKLLNLPDDLSLYDVPNCVA